MKFKTFLSTIAIVLTFNSVPYALPSAENLISPYTGLSISKKEMDNPPFLAIVENSKLARPQSGLSEADIVFETMAEGGIPRYMALFHSKSPKEIGPIRSVRQYFVVVAKEFNLPFAHCGGSPEALDTINREKLNSLNEFTNGHYYWRDNTRKAPHNLYTSAEKIRRDISFKKYETKPVSSLQFDAMYWSNLPSNATSVDMVLNPHYSTSYKYINDTYEKLIDGENYIDKANNMSITADNIVIQITSMEAGEDLRLKITQVGNGDAYVVSKGKYIKAKWHKADEKSPTILTDENNKPLYLSSGKTWWHIVDKNCSSTFLY